MESPEEVAAAAASSSSSSSSADGAATTTTKTSFTKRKRTKRLRSFSSLPPAAPPPPPPNEEEDYFSKITNTTEEEEEDMAHCLILLAQGGTAGAGSSLVPSPRREEIKLTATANTATATDAKAGFYVYECKTCNKCFPSFQALGGHRASHKKPKPAPVAVEADVMDHDVGGLEISMNSSFARVVNIAPAANKLQLRVHECSICGSEFASGQALGGHMRRHRPAGGATATAADSPELANSNNSRCMLSLDLNLPPAPSEEENAFVDRRPLALVDCHY